MRSNCLTGWPRYRRQFAQNALARSQGRTCCLIRRHASNGAAREATLDGRARLSRLWIPTGGIAASQAEDSHSKLVRAGFLRQAHPGIFHMLPLGRRVQDKLEGLIDKHMFQLGASKLALSSISSEDLWARSGRLDSSSELFRFSDRKDNKYLLSPTHEEEITSLVSSTIRSYKELPIRLYQISRKYRDELRPRHGLLRSREFVMKDLYTFDHSHSLALQTYQQVREGYARLFDELKLRYLVAEADSGDMGGNLSHEFHFPTLKGEDNVISCRACDYVSNEELAESAASRNMPEGHETETSLSAAGEDFETHVWRGISRDRLTLINVWYASPSTPDAADSDSYAVNLHAVKAILPYLDASVDDSLSLWAQQSLPSHTSTKSPTSPPRSLRLVNLLDCKLSSSEKARIIAKDARLPYFPNTLRDALQSVETEDIVEDVSKNQGLNLLRIRDGDPCPRCSSGTLQIHKAIELGHTFHLGTRYSEPLIATVAAPIAPGMDTPSKGNNPSADSLTSTQQVPLQMGCHGIGVSRIIGAVADTLADEKGLNWPRVMAPFEVAIIPSKGNDEAAVTVYDTLSQSQLGLDDDQLDLVLDDRLHSFPWKMQDADLIGYPVVVVVGRGWANQQQCEVQCRRLKICENISISELKAYVHSLLCQL